ncbi:reprolysin-like metallopeptidase [Tenacibaculum larymnensis]|uniref:M12 family metallo-peptidase n=1 Tax=Tenacibaculum larymnensis TaxID=2878201 RepID=A0A9X4ENR8_9FLAO|nr:zinc-dependent metalloprotease family protein [Tenacibaculum larymnensis]MDE1205775.1 M12 family metallo-peptidase [Tenacibaculum larymnensis]
MFKKSTLPFLFAFYLSIANLFSQQLWTRIQKDAITQQKKEVFNTNSLPKQYILMSLDLDGFKNILPNSLSKNTSNSKIIQLPNANGKLERFSIKETSYLASGLAEKFPMIKSFSAQGIDNPSSSAKVSIGKDGVHAIIFSANEGTSYINPYTKDYREYIVYKKSSLSPSKDEFLCKVEDAIQNENISPRQRRNANDGNLRTYRMAIACTGEYAQFHINNQVVSSTASNAEKKAAVLSAMNTTMTRVNSVYERDLAVRMIIVDNNDSLIFLDADTDELTNDDANTLIDESQVKCDNIIGDSNYDIGHTFSTGAGGLAQLNSVCVTNFKAQGVTGRSQPIGDTFDIDYVAHEVGHQFGATHTFNNSCDGNRSTNTAVEPGSGSTIMAYAGICSPNIQNVSDDYFHAVSIAQMWNHVQGSGSCATSTSTGNNAPTANAGNNVSIPKSTPFILKGQATDADGTSSLTYSWEQIDNETATMSPLSTNTGGPMFRSLPPSSSPDRYMPALSTVLSGNTSTTWEVLPSVARELDFALTVRDNNSGGGSSDRDDVKISIIDSQPFVVNNQPTWAPNTTREIKWLVGETNISPINCQNVNIKLSTNGGDSFDVVLIENTPNDGTETITLPGIATTNNAILMIEAADNIFYNITPQFKIDTTPDFAISNLNGDISICGTASNDIKFELDYITSNGFNEDVTFSASGAPENSTISFDKKTVNTNSKIIITIDNINNIPTGDYVIDVIASSGSITKSLNLNINKNNNICKSTGTTESQISINNVTFNNINNDSDKTTGYSDFTNENTLVARGITYDLSTIINTDGNSNIKTFAWVDWNQNCVFDTNETYEVISNSVSIRVPENAPLGSTTLRVSTKLNSSPNACESNINGEVEDYTVTVEESFATDNTLFDDLLTYPIPSNGEFTVSFKVKDKELTVIRLFDFRGRLIETQKFSTISSQFNEIVQLTKAASGLYLLQIENAGKLVTRKIAIR